MFQVPEKNPKKFGAEEFKWLYDERGRLCGAMITQLMTREELEKIYGEVGATGRPTGL